MDDLPDECLSAVLERAAARPEAPPAWAAIAGVCRRWRRLARAAITEISLRVPGVGHGYSRRREPAVLGPALVATFPSLTRLSLAFSFVRGRCHATEPSLLSATTTLTDLRVRLAAPPFPQNEFDAEDLQRTFRAISMLSNIVRALTIHDTRLDLSLADIAGFTALESLSLERSRAAAVAFSNTWVGTHWITRITDIGAEYWNTISKHMPQLRKLHIRDCRSITDNGIRQLAVSCPLLQDFRVQDCPNPSGQCAYEILTTCPEMRRLRCQQSWSCYWLQSLQTARISRLEALELYAPNDEGVASTAMAILASCCIRLRELHLHTLQTPNEDVIRPDPFENCPPMPALVRLSMRKFVTRNTSFMASIRNAPQLERLSLEDCKLVGTTGALPKQALPATTSLRFLECDKMYTGISVDFWKFGGWCPNLHSLVTSTPLFGSEILATSLAGCSRLVTLTVRVWSGLTRPPLETVRRHEQLVWTCPPLGALRTLICMEVHWQDLAAIAKASPHLREVHLRANMTVRMESVLDLLSSCPELNYIRFWECSGLASNSTACLANEWHVLRGHMETGDSIGVIVIHIGLRLSILHIVSIDVDNASATLIEMKVRLKQRCFSPTWGAWK
eukprot:SM000459S16469  [mRNA]  locus=s459:10737:12830:- [translate_table: standard]